MTDATVNEVREAALAEEVAPLVEDAPAPAPKKPAAKAKAPVKSDKAIIQELKKRVAQLENQVTGLEKELDNAHAKSEIYFKELKKVNNEATNYRKQVSDAVGILFDSTNATMRSFNMLLNK